MDIISYKSVGHLNFTDSYTTIKTKLKKYDLDENVKKFMDKRYPRIYIKELDLMINFQEDGNSVRFFEFFELSKDIFLNNVNIKKEKYSNLMKIIKNEEPNLEVEESDFTSRKFGFRAGCCAGSSDNSNELDSILIFNKDYLSEPEIDLDELYKSIMG